MGEAWLLTFLRKKVRKRSEVDTVAPASSYLCQKLLEDMQNCILHPRPTKIQSGAIQYRMALPGITKFINAKVVTSRHEELLL